MANMSYCRFHNTNIDMNDCLEAIWDGETLSDSEFIACKNMFNNILEFFEDYDIAEVDWDEFNKWLATIEKQLLTNQNEYDTMHLKLKKIILYHRRYNMNRETIKAIMVLVLLFLVMGLGNHYIDGIYQEVNYGI